VAAHYTCSGLVAFVVASLRGSRGGPRGAKICTVAKSPLAVILGSGISILDDKKPYELISYADIPGFPRATVKGHKGVLEKYHVGARDIWLMRGRVHLYEGNTWDQACIPTRYLIEQGVQDLFLTNAAGGLNSNFAVGDLMQITGYLDFMRPGRERGNISQLLTKPTKFKTETITGLQQGIYAGFHGPSYETNAEVELFRSIGGDAVGMSTIPEIETAVHAGIEVRAVSVITNVYGKTEELGHDGVVAAARAASKELENIILLQ